MRTDREGVPGLGRVLDRFDIAPSKVVVLENADVPGRDQEETTVSQLRFIQEEQARGGNVDLEARGERIDRRRPRSRLAELPRSLRRGCLPVGGDCQREDARTARALDLDEACRRCRDGAIELRRIRGWRWWQDLDRLEAVAESHGAGRQN